VPDPSIGFKVAKAEPLQGIEAQQGLGYTAAAVAVLD
jgi:hypothetical protein